MYIKYVCIYVYTVCMYVCMYIKYVCKNIKYSINVSTCVVVLSHSVIQQLFIHHVFNTVLGIMEDMRYKI